MTFFHSSRDRDHGGPEGMEPDGVIEVSSYAEGEMFKRDTGTETAYI